MRMRKAINPPIMTGVIVPVLSPRDDLEGDVGVDEDGDGGVDGGVDGDGDVDGGEDEDDGGDGGG